MLDINLIREKTEEVKTALLKRMKNVDFSDVLKWDQRRRDIIKESDELKAKRNKVSSEIPKLKKEGKDTKAVFEEMKAVGTEIARLDEERLKVDKQIQDFLNSLPNIPDDDVAAGGKENNEVIRSWGEKPEFKFKPKDHVNLVTLLNIIDYERGVKMGGNGF